MSEYHVARPENCSAGGGVEGVVGVGVAVVVEDVVVGVVVEVGAGLLRGLGASERDQVMSSKLSEEMVVVETEYVESGSVRSAMVISELLLKVMSSKGRSGAKSFKAPSERSIDPYSQSSQIPTICA